MMFSISRSKMSVLLCALLSLTTISVTAQSMSWQWAISAGSFDPNGNGFGKDRVVDIATDANGNSYVAMHINDISPKINGVPFTGYGSYDIMLLSYNCDGQLRWQKHIGSHQGDNAWNIATDAMGNVYMCGRMGRQQHPTANPPATFDTDTTLGYHDNEKSLFVVKYDSLGNYQWLRMPQADTISPASSYTHNRFYAMDVSPAGDVYIFCTLTPQALSGAGAPVLTADTNYIMHYDATGTMVKVSPVDMVYDANTTYMVSQMKHNAINNRLYIYGWWDNNPTPSVIPQLGGANLKRSFVGVFNTDGTYVRKMDENLTTMNGLAIDEQNNVYLSGDNAMFLNKNFLTQTFTSPYGDKGVPYIAKLDSNFNLLWLRYAQTSASSFGKEIAYKNNEVALIGSYPLVLAFANEDTLENLMNYGYDIFLARFDAQTGALKSLDSIESNTALYTSETGDQLAVGGKGNYYAGGYYDTDMYIGSDTLNTTGGPSEAWYAKLGRANCNCTLPIASFVHASQGNSTFGFTYTTTQPIDSLRWDFGDGGTATTVGATHQYTTSGTYTVCLTVYNACGEDTKCQQIQVTVGIGDMQLPDGVALYPNPATTTLHISKLKAETAYTLYNSVGARVQQGTVAAHSGSISIATLPAGIYILQLQDEDGVYSVRVVKE